MAWRPKDATVLAIDVGRSMREAFASAEDGSSVSKAEVAARAVRNLVQHRLFFSPKHELGIIFFGTSETNNDLQDDGYQHVLVCRDRKIDVPDVDALKCLTTLPAPADTEDADPVNALIVALDLMIKRTRDLKYNKTVHLITDARTADDPDLMECVKQCESTGTQLFVTLLDTGSTPAWSALADRSPQVKVLPLMDLAREIRLCVKPVEQRAKVRLSLIMSPEMQIPVGIYSKTTRVTFPTLRKQSKLAAAIPETNRRTDKVVLDRTYHVTDDQDGEEVKKEDRVKGHKYGSSIVPMSEYDEAALMYSCERTLTALGFAPASSIGPESSMQATDAVAADKGDRWAHCAFESIVQAMLEERRVLIARYCYRKDGQPRMVALIPLKGGPGQASHMILQYLPFAEDIREWTAASLPEPSGEQQKAVECLLDSMSLQAPAGTPNAGSELVKPEDTHNPALSRFYSFLASRAIDSASKLPPPAPELTSVISGPPAVLAASLTEALPENERVRIKTLFGLEKVEKPVGSGRRGAVKRFWREAIAEKRKDSAAFLDAVDTKKIKVDASAITKKAEKDEDERRKSEIKGEGSQGEDAGGAGGMATAVEPPPRVHIGSVHPERDFEHWLAARRTGGVDIVGPAVEQMCDVILRFADEGEEFHGKALSCLAALRRGCVREAEAAGFNEFMRKLRMKLTRRQAMLWERASKDAALGLITDTEVVTSTVTTAEARAFLEGTDTGPGSAALSSATAGLASAGQAAGTALSEKDLEAMIE